MLLRHCGLGIRDLSHSHPKWVISLGVTPLLIQQVFIWFGIPKAPPQMRKDHFHPTAEYLTTDLCRVSPHTPSNHLNSSKYEYFGHKLLGPVLISIASSRGEVTETSFE